MSFRLVPTPLEPTGAPLALREGGVNPALADACVAAPGLDPVLARLRAPDALVVTTGQQPGLFTGPLYTVYKALSAAAVAAELERRWRRPVVPLFWVAGDDHDFVEASHAAWLTADGSLAEAALPPRPPEAPLTPMYRQRLGPGIEPALAALATSLAPSEFLDATFAWLRRHYVPEATIASSFAGALAELVAPAGVVCLESTHPSVKRAAARYLVRALELAVPLNHDLESRARDLRASGREPSVALDHRATLVMLEGELGRDRLVVEGTGFITRRRHELVDLGELRNLAREEPARLSPNVLLRPVIESALLPTVAYIAGPGELSYLELTPPVYQRLDVAIQAPLPRWSGIVVEPRVDRVLDKFGIALEDLMGPLGALEHRLVRSRLPAEASAALETLRGAIDSGYAVLAGAARAVDPTLERTIQGVKNQALGGTTEVERKLVQHLKRRQATELSQLTRARTAVLPRDRPQERVLTVAPFLARYGPGLLATLAEEFRAWHASTLEAAEARA